MSEVNPTPEELVETVHISLQNNTPSVGLSMERASVIPTPIDPTLSIQGEAADAKATGDAIAGVTDSLRVNGKAAVADGGLKKITVYANEVYISSDEGSPTVAEAIEDLGDRTASDIMYDAENLVTIKGEIDSIKDVIDTELTEEEIDEIFDDVFEGDE